MRRLAAVLALAAASCARQAERPEHEFSMLLAEVNTESFVEESLATAIALRMEEEYRAGEFGRPLSDAADLLQIVWRARPEPPPRFPVDHPLLWRLSEEIRRRPEDPRTYELRAAVSDYLGLTTLAEDDRRRADELRTVAP